MFPQLARKRIGGNSRVGCVLALDFKHKDGDSFMSDDCYGHLCTNYGSKWQLDGRYFDGVGNYVECSEVSIPDYTPWTVESSLYVQSNWVNFLGDYTNDGLNLILKAGEGTVGLQRQSTSMLIQCPIGASLNTWMHIVWSVDASRNLYLYLNGELKTTVAVGQSTALRVKYIARRNTELDYSWYKGLIGGVRINNSADYIPRILSRSIGG